MSWIEMKCIFVLVYLITLRCEAQKERGERPFDNGHGWDIRFAVPGEPGNDYPTLSTIPKTSFTCSKKDPGYYADVETNCQVFRICTLGSTFGFQSFLCPNGTLFNQAVFVCDWWMNVNCKKSIEYFDSNERRNKLKVGPELMTDVKKMLTHPMRNPYDKTITRDNFIDTEQYNPPFQIMNPSDNVIIQNERNIDSFYVHSKPAQNVIGHEVQNTYDLSYAASTATPHIFKSDNLQLEWPRKFENLATFDSFVLHPTSAQNTNQFSQNINKPKLVSHDQRISQQQQQQYLNSNDYRNNVGIRDWIRDDDLHLKKSSLRFPVSIKQSTQKNYEQKSLFEDNNYKNVFSFHKNITPKLNTFTKQNYVNNNIEPTLITKTLAYRKVIQNPLKGQPKSRITFKTWIVKPSRNPRLVSEPTPYTYNTPSTISNDVVEDTPYIYTKPEYGLKRIVIQDNNNRTSIPTTTRRSLSTVITNERQNLITTPRPTPFNRLYLAPLSSVPTETSNIYLPPTTYKPISLSYLPPTTSFGLRLQENYDIRPTYATSQQTSINRDIENLTFSDILTKEKLDIKVKDLVRNTNEILRTQTLNQNKILNENIQINNEPPDGIYLPPVNDQDSGEKVTSQSQLELPRSSRLIAIPSQQLEPPKQSTYNNSGIVNSVSMLPFINESTLPKNTIERTVSLQIKIPENIAHILFNNRKMSNSNDLEILNTGSSNYLVLNSKDSDSFVPLGKLTWNKNENFSTSQDLVHSFIADSINAAKHYSNIAQQESTSSTSTRTPAQNKNTEEIEQLSNRISKLTSSQYSTTTSNVKSNERQSEQLQQLTSSKQASHPNYDGFSFNEKNVLSGQLYNLPVPVVTEQIYNAPLKNSHNSQLRQNFVESINKPKNNIYFQQVKSPTKASIAENIGPSSTITADINGQNSSKDQKNNSQWELIRKIEDSNNRISAYIHDKTTGTINHPIEDSKLISYKKDKSYFVYTNLYNNVTSNDIPIKEAQVHKDDFNSNHLTHLQYRPSSNIKEHTLADNNAIQNSNRRLDFNSNVDYEVIHNSYDNNVRTFNNAAKLSRLYDGPSSYSAPQQSIGTLQNIDVSDSTYNSRIEDFDNTDNNFNGYQRERPAKRFLF